jgi:hypothetical protein
MKFYINQDTELRLRDKIEGLELLRFEYNTAEILHQVVFWKFILVNSTTLPEYESWEDAFKTDKILENLNGVIIK